MPDPKPRHPAEDPDVPQGLPARETKPEDASVVKDLASDMDQPDQPAPPQPQESQKPAERQRTIRQRRSHSRSHWKLDQPDEPQNKERGRSFGWIFGVAALICTTVGGIIVFALAGVSDYLPSSGPSRTLQMAFIYFEQGDMNSAQQFIRATPEDDRTTPFFFSLVTRMAIAHRDPVVANDYLQKGLAAAPDDPLMLIAKAEFELAEGNFAAAITTIEKAISTEPELNVAWRVLGQAKFANKDTDGALEALERSLEIAPNSVATISAAVRIHLAQENPEAAARLFASTLEAQPNSELSITYAGFLVQQGQDEAASNALDQALSRDPGNARLLSFRAKLDLRAKNFSAAQEALRAATAAEPKNPQYWIELGHAYGSDERYLDAGNALKRAIELQPDNPTTINDLGYSYLLQKDYTNAEACFLEVLTYDPNHQFAHENLAVLYEETFNDEKAKLHRQKLQELKSKAQQQTPPPAAE